MPSVVSPEGGGKAARGWAASEPSFLYCSLTEGSQYFGRIKPGGVLALHLSNRHFDLERVVARIARESGLANRMRVAGAPSAGEAARGMESASWAVLARDERDLAALPADPRWRTLRLAPASPLWTDDYSSLVSVLR